MVVVVALGSLAIITTRGPITAGDIGVMFAMGLFCVVWMPLYPMMMFKPQERTLTLNDEGLATTIGERVGTRAWTEIDAVRERDGYIEIIVRNGNAYIVPPRAFRSTSERYEFLAFAERAWVAARSGVR